MINQLKTYKQDIEGYKQDKAYSNKERECKRETLFRLNCCERETLFRLKKEAKQVIFKTSERGQFRHRPCLNLGVKF